MINLQISLSKQARKEKKLIKLIEIKILQIKLNTTMIAKS
jgi:hypothetical protein